MANKITVLVDLVTDKAQTAAKGFKASIANAEGGLNKFKAGAASAFASVQANAGLLALSAGSALVAFADKAVSSFQSAALEAGKFADATGLSNEAASRLLEVAGDIGISAGTVESAVAKMNQAIGTGGEIVDKYGIALKTAADGSADVNETLIDTIGKINAITDPTERATAAAKIFGRGYKDAAELIGLSADELRAKLEGVADAQVFGDTQVQEARELREEMDNVHDSAERISRAFGETLVPILADAAATVNNLIDSYDRLKSKVPDAASGGPVGTLVGGLVNPTTALAGALDGLNRASARLDQLLGADAPGVKSLTDAVTDAADGVDNLDASLDGAGDSAEDLGSRWSAASIPLEGASGAMAEMRSHADELADSTEDTGDAATAAADDWNVFEDGLRKSADIVDFVTGKINDLRGMLDLTGELDDIAESFADVEEAAKDATDPAGARKYRDEVRRLQGQLLDLVQSEPFKDLSRDKRLKIIAEIERGDLESLNAALDDLTKDRFINLKLIPDFHDAFHSVNASFTPGSAPSAPTFSGVSAAPSQPVSTDARTIINYYPIGTTPTTQYQNDQIDLRRNGPR